MKRIITVLIMLAVILMVSGCDTAKTDGEHQSTEIISLAVQPSSLEMYAGERRTFQLAATLANGEVRDLTSTPDFTYSSSLDNAVIVESGYIQVNDSILEESIEVVFSSNGRRDTLKIKVSSNPITAFQVTEEGRALVNDASRYDVVVNKSLHLTSEYVPENLVIPAVAFPESYQGALEKMHLRDEAATALEKMFTAAKEEGLELYAISGYRSYSLQDRIFQYQIKRHNGSEEEANRISARPGESEHQTGLAMDISAKSVDFKLNQTFADTAEGQWLAENCAEYGFILRYLKGKEAITGYQYEPWHFRYVGVELAEMIMSEETTLEEFFMNLSTQ